jgi:hypothetical protein
MSRSLQSFYYYCVARFDLATRNVNKALYYNQIFDHTFDDSIGGEYFRKKIRYEGYSALARRSENTARALEAMLSETDADSSSLRMEYERQSHTSEHYRDKAKKSLRKESTE